MQSDHLTFTVLLKWSAIHYAQYEFVFNYRPRRVIITEAKSNFAAQTAWPTRELKKIETTIHF